MNAELLFNKESVSTNSKKAWGRNSADINTEL